MEHIRVEEVPSRLVAVVRRQVPVDVITQFVSESATAAEAAVEHAGGVIAGALFAWYHGAPSDVVDVSVGFPVTGLPVGGLAGGVEVEQRPGGLAAVVLHIGPYDTLPETYRQLDVWLNTRQLDPSAECWEEYLSDEGAGLDPEAWETRLVRPLI